MSNNFIDKEGPSNFKLTYLNLSNCFDILALKNPCLSQTHFMEVLLFNDHTIKHRSYIKFF